MDGNKIKKQEIKHQEFLDEISRKKSRNPGEFRNQMDKLARTVPQEIDINKAIKSLSPRGRNIDMNTRVYPKGFGDKLDKDNPPLILMDPSTATLKNDKRDSK